ncbi:Bacterial capsule synthesis protein PGA_cap [Sphaerochaeta pleomorpha str. Grapes]|uniref:Bacterial capsule synthesis protein PGA_cap n=1 Tax=Sphaerochaeta pleomorpha (strain ATCC BAA-1885 / DSM 22778 / Grapes) TaxID=158190 RepID=G8QW83_SPHPG|nr:CapA family protein [Sphaerochaeta pleomorpha]AEV29381.1 Bacterial capsule synthesis protein PGA_cap [Sphaerochaeta pleomorpha str. Grapes]
MKFLIGGDLVPTEKNVQAFCTGDASAILDKALLKEWESADIRIVNLEAPVTDISMPIMKNGPNLVVPISVRKGLKSLHLDYVGLANNHILDQGPLGFHSTLKILKENRSHYFGAGPNLSEAEKISVIELSELRIGLFACTEHEFSIASDNSPGANPFDPLHTGDYIKEKIQALKLDILIVLYHGGKEYFQFPSPNLQKACRYLVDKGASLVVCQHSHCIGAYEKYKGKDIVYGQGNFIFDLDNPLSFDSLLLAYEIDKDFPPKITYIPIKKKLDGTGSVYLAMGEEREAILSSLNERSKAIISQRFLEETYRDFSKKSLSTYLYEFSGLGSWFNRFDRMIFRGRLLQTMFSEKKMLQLSNFLTCEAHQELVGEGLRAEISNFPENEIG